MENSFEFQATAVVTSVNDTVNTRSGSGSQYKMGDAKITSEQGKGLIVPFSRTIVNASGTQKKSVQPGDVVNLGGRMYEGQIRWEAQIALKSYDTAAINAAFGVKKAALVVTTEKK